MVIFEQMWGGAVTRLDAEQIAATSVAAVPFDQGNTA